jgi:DNA sulfur modification protein DndC
MSGLDTLKNKVKEIQELYLADDKPWIIGYSGGKDSTATMQLIYLSIQLLSEEKREKKVWVVCSDTLVEIPTVMDRVDTTLERLNRYSLENNMPFSGHSVSPTVDESFFVNVIGRGYPAPTRTFRWCTDRMKIQPTSKFIIEKVSEYGNVIVILGSRKKESMTRAQTMANYEIKNSILRKHSTLPGAYVYTPIEDWELDDVWAFLLQEKSPWGDNNRELVTLYRKAGGDECPLVVDTTTPSCGNSRFGCWVCTVVEQDKSIHGFIDSGEAWLEPMADFRDLIKEMREMRVEHRIPDKSRKGGYGAFTLKARKLILKELLETEKAVLDKYKRRLIKAEELWAIQELWCYDGDNKKSVAEIYQKVFGNKKKIATKPPENISKRKKKKEEELYLLDLCEEYDVNHDLLSRLLFVENDLTKMRRRKGLHQRIDQELNRAVDAIA